MAPRLTPNGLLSQSNMRTEYPRQQKSQRHQSQQPSVAPNLGMSPAARYNHNLKVLRRRDPSIVSIFDQFSHVCVYHHNGNKWEKQGFEGSMFLYERSVASRMYPFTAIKSYLQTPSFKRIIPSVRILYFKPHGYGRLHPAAISRRLGWRSWQLPHATILSGLYCQ